MAVACGSCAGSGSLNSPEINPGPGPQSEGSEASGETVERIPAAQTQRVVMDFSDRFVSGLWPALDEYVLAENDLTRRTNAQRWKVKLASTSMTIAAAQDPRSALLDMAVFISVGKWAVDHHWIPEVFGEKAAPLRKFYAEMDREIWSETARILTPSQQSDLRALIKEWEKSNPAGGDFTTVRLRNLDGVELSNFAEISTTRGLLAKIQRLWGKVDQSMLYGERMIFLMERTPRILEQQSDLTIDRVAQRFPIATIDPDFESLSAIAADLPMRIDDLLDPANGNFGKSLPDIRASIESVERLVATLQKTVDSTNLLADRMSTLPFERQDYTHALETTTTALTQLNGIVTGLNQLSDAVATGEEPGAVRLARTIDAEANALLDKVFHRALILIGMFFGGILLSLAIAKMLFRGRAELPPK